MVDRSKLALEILDYVRRMSPRIEEILMAFGFYTKVQREILSLIASGEIIVDEERRCRTEAE